MGEPGARCTQEGYTILVVDDQEENLDILVSCLEGEYEIQVALSGEDALEAAAQLKPDMILLDVMMPGMDGYETCERFKSDPATANIPVIFVTALSEEANEQKGFAVGGVDFISKPISRAILLARVQTHLELQEARRNAQSLLNDTLSASVSVAIEVFGLANPMAFSRAVRMRRFIRRIGGQIRRDDCWKFELAAMLSQLGTVNLSPRTLKKIYHGTAVDTESLAHYQAAPALTHKLVARIPRLQQVAMMLKQQMDPPPSPSRDALEGRDALVLGAQLLKLAAAFDTLKLCGLTDEEAYQQMNAESQSYDSNLLGIMESIMGQRQEAQRLSVHQLRPGMILMEDLGDADGALYYRAGTRLTPNIVDIIHNEAQAARVNAPIMVM